MIVKSIALCLMFVLHVIEAPEPNSTEKPEVVGAVIPWDGVTIRVEDMLRNPRGKEDLCETLRENFSLTKENKQKVMRDLSGLSRADWAEIDNRYTYLTVSLKDVGFGYGQFIQIHFHNEQINGESNIDKIDE